MGGTGDKPFLGNPSPIDPQSADTIATSEFDQRHLATFVGQFYKGPVEVISHTTTQLLWLGIVPLWPLLYTARTVEQYLAKVKDFDDKDPEDRQLSIRADLEKVKNALPR